jgi:hypothetical protein
MRCAPTKAERFGTANTDWSQIALPCANRSKESTGDCSRSHFTGNRVYQDLRQLASNSRQPFAKKMSLHLREIIHQAGLVNFYLVLLETA